MIGRGVCVHRLDDCILGELRAREIFGGFVGVSWSTVFKKAFANG